MSASPNGGFVEFLLGHNSKIICRISGHGTDTKLFH